MPRNLIIAIAAVAMLSLLSLVVFVAFFVLPVNSRMSKVQKEVAESLKSVQHEVAELRKMEPSAAQGKKDIETLRQDIAALQNENIALRQALAQAGAQADANRKALEETIAWTKEQTGGLASRSVAESTPLSSSPAPVVGEAVRPASASKFSAPPRTSVEETGFRFDFIDAVQSGDNLTIRLRVAAIEADRHLTICGITRVFDQDGNQYRPKKASIGNREAAFADDGDRCQSNLVQDIPTSVVLTCSTDGKQVERIAAIYFTVRVNDGPYQRFNKLRDLSVSR